MASYGLLGALGGLGQGLQTIGQSLERRRTEALQWAREEASRQRAREERGAERDEDRRFQAALEGARQDRQDERAATEAEARAVERKEDRHWREQDREDRQQFQSSERQASANERRALAEYEANLRASNSARDREEAARIRSQEIQGIVYGPPNQRGYAEIGYIRRDGSIVNTGRMTYRPPRNDDNGSTNDPLGRLPPRR